MTTNEFINYFQKTYRNRTSSFLSGLMIMFSDAVALFCCVGLAFFIMNFINPSAINFRSFIYYSIFFPIILVIFYASGLYPGILLSPSEEVRKMTTISFFCYFGISLSLVFFVNDNESITGAIAENLIKDSDTWGVVCAFLLAIPVSSIGLPSAREISRHLFGKFNFYGVPAVIYCTGDSAKEIIKRLIKRPDLGYKPAVIIDSSANECYMSSGIPVFPDSKEILEIIKRLKIKVAMICDFQGDKRPLMSSYRYTIYISNRQDTYTSSIQLRDLGGILGFSATHNLTKRWNLFVKRLIDIVLCLIAAIIVVPVSIVIAIGIKATSPGPVFYGHKRVGKNGKYIKCWKFRSMYKNSQEMLEKILAEDPVRRAEWEKDRKFIDDPRVTNFGKFLRKTSLDELPQLWNIFIGEMSFVGPRPVTESELEKYGEYADYILTVTPGLSGMWQISGRSDTGYEERINLDTYYIQNWSVWLDIWIIIKTVWVVINGKGAY